MLVGAVIATAGILFGYDQGVISGALDGIRDSLDTSTSQLEVITSWVTLGALVGALIAGVAADRLGRRRAVITAGLLFIGGAVVQAVAPGFEVLVVGRLIVGFAVGVASVAAPLYASEMAPTHLRGRFISGYQLGITFGIFIAYLVAQLLDSGDWRIMFAASGVVGVALVVLIGPLPDTPRWYLKAGREQEARETLTRVLGDPDPDATLRVDRAEEDAPEASWSTALSARWRKPLMIGIGLAVFQQVTGINAIIYYANEIFKAAGFDTVAERTAATTWAIGAVNVLATLIAIAWVDRLGRRPLLLTGLVGMCLSLTTVGFAFNSIDGGDAGTTGTITLIALIVYITSFAFSLGPVVWTVINEIYPREVRGRMVSIATAFNWFSAWLVSQFFLSLTESIGQAETFWLFAGLCVVAFVWIFFKVPETKSRSLEEIEAMWGEA